MNDCFTLIGPNYIFKSTNWKNDNSIKFFIKDNIEDQLLSNQEKKITLDFFNEIINLDPAYKYVSFDFKLQNNLNYTTHDHNIKNLTSNKLTSLR